MRPSKAPRLVGERTAPINQLRAILLERRIGVPQGKRKLEHYLVMPMGEHEGGALTARMLVADMRAQWRELDRRISRPRSSPLRASPAGRISTQTKTDKIR